VRITSVTARHRLPVLRGLSNSDATHGALDYSAVHLVLRTDAGEALEGPGLTRARETLRHPAF
jgi:hypothetical protein